MRRRPVNSSSVRSVGWSDGTLELEYVNGYVYQYFDVPQPTWVLAAPMRLAVNKQHRPMYQGTLHLLAGPHRIEGGWWHRSEEGSVEATLQVERDYWVSWSEHAGVLWIFQERSANEDTAWYLHGMFA